MKKLVLIVLAVILAMAAYLFFFNNNIQSVVERQDLDKDSFFSGSLISLGNTPAGVSTQKLEAIKKEFTAFSLNASTQNEKEQANAFGKITDLYIKELEVNQKSIFFQKEKNIQKLCQRFEDAEDIIELQEEVYLDSLDLYLLSVDIEEKFGEKTFSIDPDKKYQNLLALREELATFEFGCLLT